MDWDDYDPEADPRWDNIGKWPWSEIEHLFITRDDSGWSVSAEINGNLYEVESGISDEEAESLIWDEIWWEAMEWDIDIDKEIEYSKD